MACSSFWLLVLENLESSITPLFTSLSSHTPYPLHQQILLSDPGFSYILVPPLLETWFKLVKSFIWMIAKACSYPSYNLASFQFLQSSQNELFKREARSHHSSTQSCSMTLVKQKPDFTVAQRLSLNWPLCCHYLWSIFSHHSFPASTPAASLTTSLTLHGTWDSLLFPSQGAHFQNPGCSLSTSFKCLSSAAILGRSFLTNFQKIASLKALVSFVHAHALHTQHRVCFLHGIW